MSMPQSYPGDAGPPDPLAFPGETVAVLGAGGTMGFAMARNMARAGLSIRAWNRTRAKAEPLAEHGDVHIADTPADAARGATILLTMLADTDAVESAAEQAIPALTGHPEQHPLWLQMSTIGESGTQRCVKLANSSGTGFVDAPVLGTREPAEQGKLVVLGSGPEEARPRVQPVFDAVAQKTIWVGEAGAGTRLKIVTNSWVLSVVEAGAETIALAEGLGINPDLLFQALEGGTLDLPYLRMKYAAISAREFKPPSFRLQLAAKDASLIDEAAHQHGLDLPLIETVAERLSEGAVEHGDEDFSATYLTSAPDEAA
ncbi:MAG: NAD(P)-dependent oxidoreductase [Streptosporangiaceae bacterium]|nr:NAD(P)-dependent oxidoreductase [Streptosporangiaceae bacterium]